MPQADFVATVVEEPGAPSRHTLWFLLAYYGLAAVWGARSAFDTELPAADLAWSCATCIALGWWCLVDARRRKHPIPLMSRPWFFLLALILVPGYVIWSRGWVGGVGWLALHAVLGYTTMWVIQDIVWRAMHGG